MSTKSWVPFKYGRAEPADAEAYDRQRREDEARMVRSVTSALKVLKVPELLPLQEARANTSTKPLCGFLSYMFCISRLALS